MHKQALYPKGDIDKLAEERVRMLEALEHEPERLAFVVPNREDLEQLREIDLMVFHEETLIIPDEQMRRFTYNPEVMHVLKDTSTNTVMGDITMSPLKADVLDLEAKESTSRLVNRYLRQKKNLERRRKRHAKQDLSK